jgi:hypothetical protein
MPAVGNRNASGAATIAEPFASLGDCRPAGNLLADPNLHVVDHKREPTRIANLLKRGGIGSPWIDCIVNSSVGMSPGSRTNIPEFPARVPRQIFKAGTPTYFKL